MTRPPERKPPDREPFMLVRRPEVTLADVASQLSAMGLAIGNLAGHQTKTTLGLEELRVTVNGRMDTFHEELALLRSSVANDIEPRVAEVERKTGAQKAATVALVLGKYGALAIPGGLVLRAVAKQWPQFNSLIEGILGALGL